MSEDDTSKYDEGKMNLKLRTKFYLREQKLSQGNFEIESASVDSSEELDANIEFARNKFDSDMNGFQRGDDAEFINIYKRDHGMPKTLNNQTDVKDYLNKLIDFKNSSDEQSGDENN